LPLKQAYREIFQQSDITLFGLKVVFYEKGLIMHDQRLGHFVVLYEDLTHLYFHTASAEPWLELGLKEGKHHSLPANLIVEGTVLFIKINSQIIADKFKAFKQMRDTGIIPEKVKIERIFEPCSYLEDQSPTLRNFEVNTKYNKAFSCDFLNFNFVEAGFRELLEYHTVGEFNRIRGKDFLSFSAFHQVYFESITQKAPFIPNPTQILVQRLKTPGPPSRANVVIVSGIPGSGKNKLGESLTKMLSPEGVPTANFKHPGHIGENLKFVTAKFISQMLAFKEEATTEQSQKKGF
jgi:hypothetical protein